MKVLLITGGDSSERKISIISARSVKKALIENGHLVKVYDLRKGYKPLIKISKDFDALFPILHGEEGEGGKLHKYLNNIKKPVVGTRNFKGLKQAWYKISFKKFCDKNKIRTSQWKVVKNKEQVIKFGFPSVLKASNGGSAREVIILKSSKDLQKRSTQNLLNSGSALLVERYLPGIEITVGILDGKALPLFEIIPPKNSWFSYQNRYNNKSLEIPFAPSVNKKTQKEIQDIALKIHNDINLGTYSRMDFIVQDNKYFILEVNTIPGLTPASLLPKEVDASGIKFNEFIEILLRKSQ